MIKLDSIIIKIKYRKYKAALEIKDKVTIISGPSATGKSTLHRVLEVSDNKKIIDISDKPYDLQHIKHRSQLVDLVTNEAFKEYRIYIIDAGDLSIDNEIASLIQKSRNVYFVITYRKAPIELNSSIYTIKQLVIDKDGIIRLTDYKKRAVK